MAEPAPLKRAVRQALPEERAQRIWTGVNARREKLRARRRARPWLAFAGLSAVVLALITWSRIFDDAAIALRGADGRDLRVLDGSHTPEAVLSDGSKLELTRSAQLEVLSNDERAFVTVLRRGSATFDVRRSESRRWTIETGLGTVEVLGTRFSITRAQHEVRVRVERGVVLVRAESLPGRSRKLFAGQELTLENTTSPRPSATTLRDERERTFPDAPPSPMLSANGPVAPPAAAVAAASSAIASASASVSSFDALLAQADEARARGDRNAAIGRLRQALVQDTGDSRRAVAAFTAGKLLLESGRPAEAAQSFAHCLSLSPPSALAEDALVRWIESEFRAGRIERARELARRYDRSYPAGARRDEIRRWVERVP